MVSISLRSFGLTMALVRPCIIAIATSAAAQPSTITRMFCEHALEWARDTSSAIAPATAEAPEYAELAK